MRRLDRSAVVAAVIAATLGAASAAMSAYWALGGTALLDTVGGEIERWGRERSADVVATLWLITVAKLLGGVAPLVLVGVEQDGFRCGRELSRCECWAGSWRSGWPPTAVCSPPSDCSWRLGVIDAADDADERAIAWHAFFWDPWFALWGGAFMVALWRSRPQGSD